MPQDTAGLRVTGRRQGGAGAGTRRRVRQAPRCRGHVAAGGLGSGTCAWEMAVVRSLGSKPLAPSSMLLKAAEAGPMAVSLKSMF